MKNLFKLAMLVSVFLLSANLILAQNPTVSNGIATYHTSINIGKKFEVPDAWDKVVINKNVTITGSFYMPTRTRPIEFAGESRESSIIQGDGSRPTDDGINGRSYSAIRCDKSPQLYVHDLKITKPMKFHIHGGFGEVTVERCNIIAGSETETTDGIHGGKGQTTVKDCYIDVYDDALYTIECKLVENTTFVHNKNGSPFMVSWGAEVPENHVCIIKNCTVIDNYEETDYHHGTVGWAGKNDPTTQTMHIKFEGDFTRQTNPGKAESPMYTIGRPGKTGISDAYIEIDGLCPSQSSVIIRDNTNSEVTFINCNDGDIISDYVFIDHNSSGQRLSIIGVAVSTKATGNTGDWVQWKEVTSDNGYFYLVHKATNTKLFSGDGVEVNTVTNSTNYNAQWKWVDAGSGWYRLENRQHNKWLHVKPDGLTDMQLGPLTWTGNNTKWKKTSTLKSSSIETSLECSDSNISLRLYPNPATSVLNIENGESNITYQLFSISGRLLHAGIGTQIDIATLENGIYFLKIKGKAYKFIKR